jgi:putative MATE family efflux protein
MCSQIAANTFDALMAGKIGTAALGGFAFVFPFVILMQTLAAGGIGGGIAAAVARATGRKSRTDAHDLAVHGLIIALVFGSAFTVVMIGFGRPIFRVLASARGVGDAASIDAATTYATGFFAGAVVTWILQALASTFRGLGDAAFPGRWMLMSSLMQMPLGYLLTFGVGEFAGLGIIGIGLAAPAAQCFALIILMRRIRRDVGGLSLRPTGTSLRYANFRDILRVGLMSSLISVFSSATTLFVTAFVAPYGVAALAGYGLGSRLEYFLIPLTFGIGSALTVLVGQAIGRGDLFQARRIALTGATVAFLLCGTVGVLAYLTPETWADLFTSDPAVRDATVAYLRYLGPSYAFFGLGLSLSFALQGAAQVGIPVCAAILRPVIISVAVLAGFIQTLFGLYAVAAAAIVAYGVINFAGFLLRPLPTPKPL